VQTHRVWLEIIILATAIALALALLFATLGAAAGAAAGEERGESPGHQASQNQAFQGMVTCSRCGAKHSAALNRSASTCVRMCVHAGASFALVVDESTYLLEGDSVSLKRFAGQRARIVGIRSGNTIRVVSASALS